MDIWIYEYMDIQGILTSLAPSARSLRGRKIPQNRPQNPDTPGKWGRLVFLQASCLVLAPSGGGKFPQILFCGLQFCERSIRSIFVTICHGHPPWGIPPWGNPPWGIPPWGIPPWGIPPWGFPLGSPHGDSHSPCGIQAGIPTLAHRLHIACTKSHILLAHGSCTWLAHSWHIVGTVIL